MAPTKTVTQPIIRTRRQAALEAAADGGDPKFTQFSEKHGATKAKAYKRMRDAAEQAGNIPRKVRRKIARVSKKKNKTNPPEQRDPSPSGDDSDNPDGNNSDGNGSDGGDSDHGDDGGDGGDGSDDDQAQRDDNRGDTYDAPAYAARFRHEFLYALHVGSLAENEIILFGEEIALSFEEFIEFDGKQLKSFFDTAAGHRERDARVNYSARKRQYLKNLLYWTLDQRRIASSPNAAIRDIVDKHPVMYDGRWGRPLYAAARELRDRVTDAGARQAIREQQTSETPDIPAKWDENKDDFRQKEEEIVNYLSAIMGTNGVTLDYVVRSNDDGPPDDERGDLHFEALAVYLAPRYGPKFEADTRMVYKLISPLFKKTTAEQWYKQGKRSQCGMTMMNELRQHFFEGGNRRLKVAKALARLNRLHYRGEQSMTFESFLSKMDRCFVEMEEDDEGLSDQAKCRHLFDKIKGSSVLAPESERLQDDLALSRGISDYSSLAQLMTAIVARKAVTNSESFTTKANQGRRLAAMHRDDGSGAPASGIYGPDGKIYTGKYTFAAFKKLSKEEREKLREAREKKGGHNKSQKQNGRGGGKKNNLEYYKQQAANQQRKVQELLTEKQELADKLNESARKAPSQEPTDDKDEAGAGNQFGGRAGAAAKKGKN